MSDESEDSKVAKALGLTEQHIGAVRNAFFGGPDSHIICKLFETRIGRHLDEQRNKLETITADKLEHTQGKIAAFKLALTALKPAQ